MSKYEIKNKNKYSNYSLHIAEDYTKKELDLFLKQRNARAKDFFYNLGMIIDVEKIKQDKDFNEKLKEIVEVVLDNNFLIIGISNNKDSKKDFINNELKLPTLHGLKTQQSDEKVKEVVVEKVVEKVVEITPENAEMGLERYEGIVRGGQRIYAKGKHLIIIGDVKPNAEIIADGDIIVLGSLNGKAIAGANDNENATITASDFKASMISIAGNYRQFEEDSEFYGSNKQLLIQDGKLIVEKY